MNNRHAGTELQDRKVRRVCPSLKTRKFFVTVIAALFATAGSPQSAGCDMLNSDVPQFPEALGLSCGVSLNYAPRVSAHTPVKVCRVAFHVLQDDQGLDGFQDTPADILYLRNIEDRVNEELANLSILEIGASPYIPDSRLRIVVEDIYFHRSTANYLLPGIPPINAFSVYVLNDVDGIGYTDDEKWNVEHVFIKGGTTGAVGGLTLAVFPNGTQSPWIQDVGNHGWIRAGGWYSNYTQQGPGSFAWPAQNLTHELCHAWGLPHNYGGGGCDACTDNDAVVGGPCPSIGTSNNYMDVYPSGWSNGQAALSECQMGILHYYLDGNVPSKSIYRTVLRDHCTYDPDATINIVDAGVVWSDSKKLKGDLVVQEGAALTVRCRVHIPSGGKVIVKPGGRLIVDEGHFTNLCGEFWSGIEVWGNSNEHQYPASNPTHQGLLILKNGATIEHAREASRNWKPGDWDSMGGVIQVQGTPAQVGAIFKNCRRSAEFMKYQNFQPGDPNELRTNLSYFSYAQFIVDDDYRGVDDFEGHVSMWGVDGIQFRACVMQSSQNNVLQSERLGEGILSIDANYVVSGNCTVILPYGTPCPEANLNRGKFVGLGNGIYSLDGGSGRGFTASNLDFENNIVGLYAGDIPGFTAVRNRFTLGDRNADLTGEHHQYFLGLNHRGISTQGSFGFRIEENSFGPAANIQANGIDAIVIENSKANSTQVYKNTATGMSSGYIAEGNCMDYMDASAVGHEFLCNINTDNEQNFLVRKDDYENTETSTHCERTQQGSNDVPAGNTFDQGTGDSDYRNQTSWVINYWHKGGISQPIAVTPGWVGTTLATGTNNCPSRLGGKEIKLNDGHKMQAQNDFQNSKTAYINTSYVFKSLLDGGNTAAVVDEVVESWPAEAWDLRNYLMSKSPYLSTEVLVEMMKKNTLPQAMVLEICLANPEATKKEGFTKWAEYEAPSPLPSYMIDLIAGSWAPKTFRMELEAQIGQHHTAMTVANDMLQAAYRAEEEIIPLDAMLTQWNAMPNYGARFAEAQVLMRKGQYATARTMIQALGERYPLKEGREAERDRTVWYIDQLQALELADRSIMQLNAAELAQWQTFAETASDIPGNWAANVLCFGYKICVDRGGSDPSTPKALHPRTSDLTFEAAMPLLSVSPNPADAWATLKHTIAHELNNAHLRVVDAIGREVVNFPLNAAQAQTLWDTRDVPAGMYSVELYNAGARLAVEPLVVQPTK